MEIKLQKTMSWTFVLAGILLLIATGRLDLLFVVIPAAVAVAYGIRLLPPARSGLK